MSTKYLLVTFSRDMMFSHFAIFQKFVLGDISHGTPSAHFVVKKVNHNKDTKINVIKINLDEKIKEVARMLSGKVITQEAIKAAKKLIEN